MPTIDELRDKRYADKMDKKCKRTITTGGESKVMYAYCSDCGVLFISPNLCYIKCPECDRDVFVIGLPQTYEGHVQAEKAKKSIKPRPHKILLKDVKVPEGEEW